MSEPGVKVTARGVFVDPATWARWEDDRHAAIAKADALDRTARTRPVLSRDDLKAQIAALQEHNEQLLREIAWLEEVAMDLRLRLAAPCPECEEHWTRPVALRAAA